MKQLQKFLAWFFTVPTQEQRKPLSRIELLAHLRTQRKKNGVDNVSKK